MAAVIEGADVHHTEEIYRRVQAVAALGTAIVAQATRMVDRYGFTASGT